MLSNRQFLSLERLIVWRCSRLVLLAVAAVVCPPVMIRCFDVVEYTTLPPLAEPPSASSFLSTGSRDRSSIGNESILPRLPDIVECVVRDAERVIKSI
jgi:hypothetical protein